MNLHHPLVQSLLLPAGIAFVGCGLVRSAGGPGAGARWAAVAIGPALIAGTGAVAGWAVSPNTMTGKLPWVIAAGWLLGLSLEAMRASRWLQWAAASALWAAALAWLGPDSIALFLAAFAIGTLVIAAVVRESSARADASAILAMASLGLAGVAMLGASLLLFQFALGTAAALAGGALFWLWPKPRIAFGARATMPATFAWLGIAIATVRLTPTPGYVLALLAAAFGAGALVARATAWQGPLNDEHVVASARADWREPLLRGIAAALVAASAVGTMLLAAPTALPNAPQTTDDDAYYKPDW